jgi:hypothetical protein
LPRRALAVVERVSFELAAGKGSALDAVVKLVRRGNGFLLAHRSRLAEDVHHVNEDTVSEVDLVRLEWRSLMLGLGCSFDSLRIGNPRDFKLAYVDRADIGAREK